VPLACTSFLGAHVFRILTAGNGNKKESKITSHHARVAHAVRETDEFCALEARAATHVMVDASLVKLLCGCGVAPSIGHVEKEGQPSQLLLPNHRWGGCRAPTPSHA
jgi:hypothetical protein